jgi:hypothetical protein
LTLSGTTLYQSLIVIGVKSEILPPHSSLGISSRRAGRAWPPRISSAASSAGWRLKPRSTDHDGLATLRKMNRGVGAPPNFWARGQVSLAGSAAGAANRTGKISSLPATTSSQPGALVDPKRREIGRAHESR